MGAGLTIPVATFGKGIVIGEGVIVGKGFINDKGL